MSKEVLITGGSGYVMSFASERLEKRGLKISAPSHRELDFTDLDAVRRHIKETGCEIFIHAGAYTNVQSAKKDFELARLINGIGTKNVAIACAEEGVRMVLLSSDFIFPGNLKNKGPYREDAKRPESHTSLEIGHYGKSKLMAEYMAQKYCPEEWLTIIRLSYPFGSWCEKDYLSKLLKTIKSGKGLFKDQIITPTDLSYFSDALLKVINSDVNGILHIVSDNSTTPYEVGTHMIKKLNLKLEVKEGSCKKYLENPSIDIIPQHGGLNGEKSKKQLGLEAPTWQESVNKHLGVS